MRRALSAWSLALVLGLFASSSAFAGFAAGGPNDPPVDPPVNVDPCLPPPPDCDEYTRLMSYMSGRCGYSGHHHSSDRDRDGHHSRSRDRDDGRKGYSDRDDRRSGGHKQSGGHRHSGKRS